MIFNWTPEGVKDFSLIFLAVVWLMGSVFFGVLAGFRYTQDRTMKFRTLIRELADSIIWPCMVLMMAIESRKK